MKTHRCSERMQLAWPAEWRIGRAPSHRCEVLDLSEFGAFVACPDPEGDEVHGNDPIAMRVTVGDERFEVEGRVRWIGVNAAHHRMGFGVAFDPSSVFVCEAMAFAMLESSEGHEGAAHSTS